MTEYEEASLKKQIVILKERVDDLMEELKEAEDKIRSYEDLIEGYQNNINEQRDNLARIDQIINEGIAKKVGQELARNELLEKQAKADKDLIQEKLEEINNLRKIDKEKDDSLEHYKRQLNEISSGNYELKTALEDIKKLRDQVGSRDKEITKYITELNLLDKQIGDLKLENEKLREMANVPSDFGMNLDDLKHKESIAIAEIKNKNKFLEAEVDELEQERTRLKCRLRQMSEMNTANINERYKDLSPDQIFQLDQFVIAIKEGTANIPGDNRGLREENKQLREQIRALKEQNLADITRDLKQTMNLSGAPPDILRALNALSNDIRNINLKNTSGTFPQYPSQNDTKRIPSEEKTPEIIPIPKGAGDSSFYRLQQPPNVDELGTNTIEGFSFRYKSQLNINPFDLEKFAANRFTREDVAIIQLQLIECITSLERKEEEQSRLIKYVNEVESKLRKYITEHNLLYRTYATESKEWNDEKQKMMKIMGDLREEEEKKKINLDDLLSIVKGIRENLSDEEYKSKWIDSTMRNSAVEVELIKYKRLYNTIISEHDVLRIHYNNIEKDCDERIMRAQESMKRLKEWKAKAIVTIRSLFDKLRNSIPKFMYDELLGKQINTREKEIFWLNSSNEKNRKITELLEWKLKASDSENKIRELEELRHDTEEELEIVKRSLELKDPHFAASQKIMFNIVSTLKKYRVDPEKQFEIFDDKKEGAIHKEEFLKALQNMKIDINIDDINNLFLFLDDDPSGRIRYKSFVKRLRRYGVKSKTDEDILIQSISESLKRRQLNLLDAFKIIDKNGDGYIDKKEFKEAIKSLRIGIKDDESEKVLSFLYPNTNSGIDYKCFIHLFEKNAERIAFEEKKYTDDQKEDFKTKFLLKIDDALMANSTNIKDVINQVSLESTEKITKETLKNVLSFLKINYQPKDLHELFAQLNPTDNTFISFIDLAAELQAAFRRARLTRINNISEFSSGIRPIYESDIASLKGLVVQLKEKENFAIMKFEREMTKNRENIERIHSLESLNAANESKFTQLTKSFIEAREKISILEAEIGKKLPFNESLELRKKNDFLLSEQSEMKTAIETFKSLYEYSVSQVKSFDIALSKSRDDCDRLTKQVRDLQSGSTEETQLGKLMYIVMLSRNQESSTAKKYEDALYEMKEISAINYKLEKSLEIKEDELKNLELRVDEQVQIAVKMKEENNAKYNPKLTFESFELITSENNKLTNKFIQLEEENSKIKTDLVRINYLFDDAESKRTKAEELVLVLKSPNETDIANKLIELSEKIESSKLAELNAVREMKLMKVKEEYLDKTNNQLKDSVKKLEEEVAKGLAKYHQKEEEWRAKDAERQKQFFDLREKDYDPRLEREESYESKKDDLNINLKEKSNVNVQPPIRTLPSYAPKDMQKLNEENELLKRELERKNRTISNWEAQNRLINKDESVNEQLMARIGNFNASHDAEIKEISEAAHKTIKTFQGMVEDKDNQLKRKDKMINDLRDEIKRKNEEHIIEIAKLNEQLGGRGQGAMGKIIGMAKTLQFKDISINKNEGMKMEHIELILSGKDNVIKELNIKIQALENEKIHLHKEKEEVGKKLDELNLQLILLKEKTGKTKLEEELKKTKTLLKNKEKEVENLRKAIEQMKKEILLEIEKQANSKKQEDINSKALKEKEINPELETKAKQVQEAFKKNEEKLRKAHKEINIAKEKITELSQTNTKHLDEISILKKDNDDLRKKLNSKGTQSIKFKEELELKKLKTENLLATIRQKEDEINSLKEQAKTKKTLYEIPKELPPDSFSEAHSVMSMQEFEENEESDEIIETLSRIRRNSINTIQIFKSKAIFSKTMTRATIKESLELCKFILSQNIEDKIINFLNKENEEYYYEDLSYALMGQPVLLFFSKTIQKIAYFIYSKDLSEEDLKKEIGRGNNEITWNEFEGQLKILYPNIENYELEDIQKRFQIANQNTYDIIEFTKVIMKCIKAILINQFVLIAEDKNNKLENMFIERANPDTQLIDFNNLMEICKLLGVDLDKPNQINTLFELFDPSKKSCVDLDKFKFNFRLPDVSRNILAMQSSMPSTMVINSKEYDLAIDNSRKLLLRESKKLGIILKEILKLDKYSQCIVRTDEILSVFESLLLIPPEGLAEFRKMMDRSNFGYVCTKKLHEELSAWHRGFNLDCALKKIKYFVLQTKANINILFKQYDNRRIGKLTVDKMKAALINMKCGLTKEEIDGICLEFKRENGNIDISEFSDNIKLLKLEERSNNH